MPEVLVFDLSGRYGTFKTPETTRSAMTFPFPPRTSVLGLVGAILGLPKNSYWADVSFRDSVVAVEVLRPGRRSGVMVNFTQTKDSLVFKAEGIMIPIPKNPLAAGSRGMNTQQRLDLLVEPTFRIYFGIADASVMDKLEQSLRDHLFAYPPYLGHANFLGEVNFVGRYAYEFLGAGEYTVSSLASLSTDDQMRLRGDFVMVHGVPMSMIADEIGDGDSTTYTFGRADIIDTVAYQVSGQNNPIVVKSKKPGVVIKVHSQPPVLITPFPASPPRAS
jgi:CRISPR-associated protein Cas5h